MILPVTINILGISLQVISVCGLFSSMQHAEISLPIIQQIEVSSLFITAFTFIF